ncbi:hypothetical protein Q1695_009342 [Nippostrongylus brasiliensis]|nr:hypothetical protein Q1695_009342 [Nippostrongylus brasiliensis]
MTLSRERRASINSLRRRLGSRDTSPRRNSSAVAAIAFAIAYTAAFRVLMYLRPLEIYSSSSDEDVYTRSIDIRNVGCPVNASKISSTVVKGSARKSRKLDAEIILADDDSDSLSLSEPENNGAKRAKRQTRRKERIEREQMAELEEIMAEPIYVESPRNNGDVCRSNSLRSSFDAARKIIEETPLSPIAESLSADVVSVPQTSDKDKEVDLFVTFGTDKASRRPGRIIPLPRDEPFDKLRPVFAKELGCNQLDVLIHVNNADAGPGDTPDSMGLDVTKLAIVNVFCLKPGSVCEEDVTENDPNLIPIKCIFDKGRPRMVWINVTETFADAKKRIVSALHLTGTIDKLVFDSEVLVDDETPQGIEMEADDVIEVQN